MRTDCFYYLTGSISISAEAPKSFEYHGLDEFYRNPNYPEWAGKVCRLLIHESIHFWQFFSSGYLANLLADDWLRVKKFNDEKIVAATAGNVEKHFKKENGYPFSASELTECWARYWDVHTRNPREILQEDEVLSGKPEIHKLLNSAIDINYPQRYSMALFDTFMSEGKDCKSYAEPYRWMLTASTSGSRFVNTIFPPLIHGAFGSPYPVQLFCEAFYVIETSKQLKRDMLAHMNANIHFNWFHNWQVVINIINQVVLKMKMPQYTSGLQVIERGPLKTHPIYQMYSGRIRKLFTALTLFSFEAKPIKEIKISEEDSAEAVEFMERDMCSKFGGWIAFGLPGQPNYRGFLGLHIPPPCIHFSNMTYYAHETSQIYHTDNKHEEFATEEEFKYVISELNEKVRRFNNAKKAKELGLPLDRFN